VPTSAHAAPPSYLALEATYANVANGWSAVERYLDTTSGFTQESYPPDGRGDQDGQRLTFFGGVKRPFSGRFLLYYAPGWNTNPKATPVLLVHGANDNPDRAWANPGESGGFGCGASPTTMPAIWLTASPAINSCRAGSSSRSSGGPMAYPCSWKSWRQRPWRLARSTPARAPRSLPAEEACRRRSTTP